MKKVSIYTDGACSGNPGDGGWGAILIYGKHEKELSGFEKDTTNNRMELKAAIYALQMLKEPCEVDLYSDSAYLVNGFLMNWVKNWKNNGWKTSGKEDVKNVELWKELDRLSGIHKIRWIKVKGHSDNEYNNRCDKLATDEIRKNRQ
ncbi:ribonuclease HI [Acetivibrio mesophilus]|uniref:Ribonuclease H n=1 Tax=Acetivibrio mesophilus TaxID=2487273 RepID=A0A4Q0I6X4_9FIRM|nr:ribonuclease HI [Acetivibrio mesophilus]ODM25487.1 ribonuclease HI [Clostridium sp. Bc-iso-3]RXE60100.1 ribonuclease HI [Acetivibrio mesophilus]HHV29148.1 ribonuclease HI [Clostridium sp.]